MKSSLGKCWTGWGSCIPRLASLDDRYLSDIDGFAEKCVMGFNILAIQRERKHLTGEEQSQVNAVLSGIAELFRQRVARREAVRPSAKLQEQLDSLLSCVSIFQENVRGRKVLDALVGLRRALFP